jgi:hypothetical protein
MSSYKKSQWQEFRKGIIESDGHKCTECGKTALEATLQVHHKKYIEGKEPWEYAPQDCITLCKGCHASIHGKIKPKFGWEYMGDEDLGELIGECENCGNDIRYVFYVFHEKWGTIEVGTLCCDNLTDSQVASNRKETLNRYRSRKKRFLKSNRWQKVDNVLKIKQGSYWIEIEMKTNGYYLTIHGLKSDKMYKTLEEAKAKAFDVIETGKFKEYLEKRGTVRN